MFTLWMKNVGTTTLWVGQPNNHLWLPSGQPGCKIICRALISKEEENLQVILKKGKDVCRFIRKGKVKGKHYISIGQLIKGICSERSVRTKREKRG